MKRYVKDSHAIKDYKIDWSQFLGADTISTSTWTPAVPLWVAQTAYRVGDRVRLAAGAFLEATVAGTSGVSAPAPPAVGATVTDGTVTWLRAFNIESSSNTTTTATVWVSGGTVGQEYGGTNRIVTAGGRTEEETFYFVIVEK